MISQAKNEYQILGTGFNMEICGEISENWVVNYIAHQKWISDIGHWTQRGGKIWAN